MRIAGKLNLLIQQGSDNPSPADLQFRHTVIASAAVTGGTSIPVYALPVALSSGTVLPFGSVRVTLSANALEGAETISVNSFSGSIAADTQAAGPAIDLTGYTFAAKLRASYDDTSALATFGITAVSLTTGRIRLTLANAITSALESNIKWFELPDEIKTNPSALQDDSLFSRKALSSAYYWDWGQCMGGMLS